MNELYGCINSPSSDIPTSVKEPGIFEVARETTDILAEVLDVLNLFNREVCNKVIPEEKSMRPAESTCFKENIYQNKELACAILGDLKRLLSNFH